MPSTRSPLDLEAARKLVAIMNKMNLTAKADTPAKQLVVQLTTAIAAVVSALEIAETNNLDTLDTLDKLALSMIGSTLCQITLSL